MTPASNNTVERGHNVLLAQEKGQLTWINCNWRGKDPETQHRTLAEDKTQKELTRNRGDGVGWAWGPDCVDVRHGRCNLSYGVLCC